MRLAFYVAAAIMTMANATNLTVEPDQMAQIDNEVDTT